MTNKFSSTFITNFTVDTYMILVGRFNIGSSPSNIADTNPKILSFTIKIAIQITKIYNYCLSKYNEINSDLTYFTFWQNLLFQINLFGDHSYNSDDFFRYFWGFLLVFFLHICNIAFLPQTVKDIVATFKLCLALNYHGNHVFPANSVFHIKLRIFEPSWEYSCGVAQ